MVSVDARLTDELPPPHLVNMLAVLRRPQTAAEQAVGASLSLPLLETISGAGVRLLHDGRFVLAPGERSGQWHVVVLERGADQLGLVCSRPATFLQAPTLPTAATGNRIVDLVPDDVRSVELRFAEDGPVNVRPRENLWAVSGPRVEFPAVMRWLDAGGRELHRAG